MGEPRQSPRPPRGGAGYLCSRRSFGMEEHIRGGHRRVQGRSRLYAISEVERGERNMLSLALLRNPCKPRSLGGRRGEGRGEQGSAIYLLGTLFISDDGIGRVARVRRRRRPLMGILVRTHREK